MNVSKRIVAVALAIVLTAGLFGCSKLTRSKQPEESLASQLRKDMAIFQENIAGAYFVLGYEYLKLAEEYKKTGDEEKARFLITKAKLYHNMYSELNRSIKLNREVTTGRGSPIKN